MSKTILTQVDGFTPLPDLLVTKYGQITATVWGAAWRFCQMEDGICRASMEKIGKRAGVSRQTAQKHMDILTRDGFFEDTTPNLKNKPHIYKDTGKVSMYNRFGIGVNEIDSGVKQIDSHCQPDRHEDSIKKDNKKDIIESANKKVDAILEQERKHQEKLANRETWPHREKFPEPIREMLDVFVKCTGMRPAKKDVMDWMSTGQDWLDLGIISVDLEKAYQKSRGDEGGGGFVVGRPGSLTNTANMFAGERRTGGGKTKRGWTPIPDVNDTMKMLEEKWSKHDKPRTKETV